MKICITGGAGYVGSVVASDLLRAGHHVVVYDNLSRGHRKAVPDGAELVVGDLSNPQPLIRIFQTVKPDAVMHFAALIEAGESMQVPERYFRNNAMDTLTLLEVMLAHGVTRLVFSSTAAVYGNPAQVPIDETMPLEPTNAYGESKRMAEQMLEWFHRVHGLRYASLRYFNAAGAANGFGEDHRPESHLIPRILKVALGQVDSVTIFGTDYPTPDGTCIRDYVHVSDLSSAHVAAVHALHRRSRLVCNVGTGRGFSVREVIEAARRVTCLPITAVEGSRRPGDPPILVASAEKIRRELNWHPQCSELEAILSTAWEWHRRNPAGYANE